MEMASTPLATELGGEQQGADDGGAATHAGEGCGLLPVERQRVGAEDVALDLLCGQPLHQLHHLALAGAFAVQDALATVDDRRAGGLGQREQAALVAAKGGHEVGIAGHPA